MRLQLLVTSWQRNVHLQHDYHIPWNGAVEIKQHKFFHICTCGKVLAQHIQNCSPYLRKEPGSGSSSQGRKLKELGKLFTASCSI